MKFQKVKVVKTNEFISHTELRKIIKRIAIKGDDNKRMFIEISQLKKEVGM